MTRRTASPLPALFFFQSRIATDDANTSFFIDSSQTSEHGKAMIESEAIRQNNEDMTVLKEKIIDINAKIKSLRMEVEAEKLAKKEAQLRVQVRMCEERAA